MLPGQIKFLNCLFVAPPQVAEGLEILIPSVAAVDSGKKAMDLLGPKGQGKVVDDVSTVLFCS
jgi:hypothetical protein